MHAVHETVPKLLLFLLLAIPAVSFVVLRSLALVRHGKAARVASAFGLSAGEVPLYFPLQLRFRPRISGVLDGRRVEVSEISEVNAFDMQRPVTSTAFLLELKPTLSKQMSARRKHVGKKVMAIPGAPPTTTSLGIPLLDAKVEVSAFSPSDRECLAQPGVQNALLRLLFPGGDFRIENGELRLTWPGAFSETRWRELLTLGTQLARALSAEGTSPSAERSG